MAFHSLIIKAEVLSTEMVGEVRIVENVDVSRIKGKEFHLFVHITNSY